MSVPKAAFDRMTEFAFGGIFGFIEQQARRSQGILLGRTYGYQDREGRVYGNLDRNSAFGLQRESHGQVNIVNWHLVSDSWAVNLSLVSFFDRAQTRQKDLPQEKVKIYNDSLKEMAKRLRKKGCYEALGFKSKKEVDQFLAKKGVFSSFNQEPVKKEGLSYDQYDASVAYTDVDNKKIFVNSYGGFFADSNGNVTGPKNKLYYLGNTRGFFSDEYSNDKTITSFANDNIFRAFVLLHEVSHYTGKFGPDAPGVKDYEENQKQNNDNVLKNCFKVTSSKDKAGILTTIFN